MKKFIFLLILPFFLGLVFSGCCCPKKKAVEPPAETVAAPPEAKEEVPPPVTEPAVSLDPIYFDFDKSNLKPDATATLGKNADWLSKNSTAKIRIEGNCDERGTIEYNVALGERRANIAKQYLIKLGVTADRLSTISYGKEKPLCTEHNDACWSKNRRDDFKVVE
ncbi:MAG: peptidoglycan-associated lipoprotein Pal [Thermodesulfobacteriota bacterium]|jgi:peptidoglycan-associated lipoprotein|nr:MAG: peptidoglycan-associated lipoprotein Pal [Thermodesulfobacteriota bacterium]